MKRLLAFFLILMFLAGVSIAESSPDRAFTADEQAYDVYLDVSYVHNQSVRYLSEMERLWDLANDLDSVSDADKLWFHAGLVANFGNNDAETLSRLYAYQHLATVKYGYSQIPELYPLFEALLSAGGRKTTDSIWAGLALDIEAQYIVSPDEMKAYMDDAKEGIRNIMSTDRSYPYLQDLQNYYKEASYLLDYISNFKDNYLGLNEMLDTQKKNQSSYTIDFEFIFDPANFDYVMEVRAAETAEKQKAIYDRALALENSGDYAGAIGLYWQCSSYSDASERIESCRSNIHEADYQKAILLQNAGNYDEAIVLFGSLGDYKDTRSRLAQCREAILPCEDIGSFNEGLAAIKKDGKYGYVDIHGNLVIAREFDAAGMFVCGLAPVCKNEKWGYIDKTGQMVVPCQYDGTYGIEDGVGLVENDGKCGLVDLSGNLIVPCIYDSLTINEGLARVMKEKKVGFINTAGEIAIPLEYQGAELFYEGFAVVKKDGILGFIDTSGNMKKIQEKDCRIYGRFFNEGLTSVKDKNDKIGFADTSGKVVIPCQFDEIKDFHDGLACAMKDNRWGLIDLSGKWLVTLPYRPIGKPMNGIICVWNNGKYGFINTNGDPVLDFAFDECAMYSESNGYYRAQQDGKYGVVNPNGKLEIPCEYSVVRYYSGYYTMIKNGKFYIQKAEEVIPRATVIPESADPVAEKPSNYITLKPGSKGQAVLDARMKLYELGYFSKKPTQTEYTENMKDYVKKFEKDNGLKQDGILSPEDQEVLFGL